ncbi:LTA synthase family protein [Candidatus Uabimicrobium amorphum]|uniref:LTA synthase family protein n=1 Tax=Uabimicrobium amorphum TaxID=2596890 RepID=UPI001566CD2B|nr:LTA synthase family protein [Candidatus Uabimicrobium amorphum]
MVNFLVLIIFIIDFGFYDYLGNRLTAVVLRFFYNPEISWGMVTSSYPFAIILSIVFFFLGLFLFGYRYVLEFIHRDDSQMPMKKSIAIFLGTLLFSFAGIYAKFSRYPLFWSDAYFSSNSFVSNTALNPVLLFFESCLREDPDYDENELQKNYEVVSEYLGVKDKKDLNFTRSVTANTQNRYPNLVIVFMESLAFHFTSLSGNPLRPTPNFDALTKKSIYFERFYTPHRNTARSIFTTITGLPDIGMVRSTSRNPMLVKQHTILNDFHNYNKYYFVGGSANWGNIRGILANNIKDLQLYEEHMYESPNFDVWGISDLHLFEEFIKTIKRKSADKPFVAFIQTAGNHSPFRIPPDNRGFVKKDLPTDEVRRYCFRRVKEYNSLRFLDHSLGVFLQQIEDPFFDNTIFCFFGDHGKRVHTPEGVPHMHKSAHGLGLTQYRVPMVIYAPKIIKPFVYKEVASQVDILPTLASFTSVSYVNKGLGRNLFDNSFRDRYAFTLNYSAHEIGLMGKNFYFLASINGEKQRFYDITSPGPLKDIKNLHPEKFTKFKQHCFGLYQFSKYMRVKNNAMKQREKHE